MRLTSGQNILISTTTANDGGVEVLVNYDLAPNDIQINIYAMVVNSAGKMRSAGDIVFHNQPVLPGSGILFSMKTNSFSVFFERLPNSIAKVVFVALLSNISSHVSPNIKVKNINVCLRNIADQTPIASMLVNIKNRLETAIILGEFYKRNSDWKFKALDHGFKDGFIPLVHHFGLILTDYSYFFTTTIPDSKTNHSGDSSSTKLQQNFPLPLIYKKAEMLFTNHQYKEAAVLIEFFARKNSKLMVDKKVLFLLSACYTNIRNYPKAEEVFRALLHLFPDHYEAAINLAKVLKAQGKGDEAKKQFFIAYEINPQLGYVELNKEHLLPPNLLTHRNLTDNLQSRGNLTRLHEKTDGSPQQNPRSLSQQVFDTIHRQTLSDNILLGDDAIKQQRLRRPGDPGQIILKDKMRRYSSYLTHWFFIFFFSTLGITYLVFDFSELPGFYQFLSQNKLYIYCFFLTVITITLLSMVIDRITMQYTIYEGLVEINIGFFMNKHQIWFKDLNDATIDQGAVFGLYYWITNTAQIALDHPEGKRYIKAIGNSEEMDKLHRFLRNQINRDKWISERTTALDKV